jgi:hypothetical protein
VFNPSKDDVRRFFCEAWSKASLQMPLAPIEVIAVDWIREHPEYHQDLANADVAVAKTYSPESGQTNPFLHLSMHLSIEEQVSIDQPPGIRDAFQRLAQRLDDRHEAMHEVMECLAEALWRSQREQTPIDAQAYLEAVRIRATR